MNNYIPLFASLSFSPTMVGLKTGKGLKKLFRVWKHFVSRAKQLVSARETNRNSVMLAESCIGKGASLPLPAYCGLRAIVSPPNP